MTGDMRRGITMLVMILCVASLPAVTAQANSGHRLRTLTTHRAWLVTVAGARRVVKSIGRVGEGVNSYKVQPESACVRHSRSEIDCPFSYLVGDELAENFERCHDTGRVTEVAEKRFRFTALKPRCQLINNETP